MSAAPATAGRNAIGVLGLGLFLFLGYLALAKGDAWTWFAHHPGALTAMLVGIAAMTVVTVASGSIKAGVLVGLVLAALVYVPPDVRSTVGDKEATVLGSSQTHGGRR